MSKKLTKDYLKINNDVLLVTVDVSKIKNVGYARCPNGNELSNIDFFNTGEGYKYFLSEVEKYRKMHELKDILVGLESTGVYGEPLIHFLYKRKIKVVQVNPMHTKRVKEIRGNSPNKTDEKDPKVIADIILLGNALSVVIPEGEPAHLRRLTHLRENKLVDIGRVYNHLETYIMLIFPEFLHIMKNLKTKTAKYILNHYSTPGMIIQLGPEALQRILKKVSRGQFGSERAIALYNAAKTSSGITEGLESLLYSLTIGLEELQIYEKQIAEIEQRMMVHLEKIPYAKYIQSIRGLGLISVAGLIGEIGDIRRYDSARELLKLAGLNLYEVSSGQHKGERHITKRGRSLMRKILFYAALNVVREGGILHETYSYYVGRGMNKIKALTAISRKLVCIIYALVRDSSDYRENYNNFEKAA